LSEEERKKKETRRNHWNRTFIQLELKVPCVEKKTAVGKKRKARKQKGMTAPTRRKEVERRKKEKNSRWKRKEKNKTKQKWLERRRKKLDHETNLPVPHDEPSHNAHSRSIKPHFS